jgi:cytochrome c oxidase assembly protein subunit 11
MAASSAPAANVRVASLAALVAAAMLGLGYASVPLYRLFCQVTGYGGTPQRASEAQAAGVHALAGQKMSIRFDANIDTGMKWRFAPEATTATVTIGERAIAFYSAQNLSDQPITGQATYNIAPAEAARYFTKVACFCFTRQTLRPHEQVRMPVTYYVDPAILSDPDLKGLGQITLSYTFHPLASAK